MPTIKTTLVLEGGQAFSRQLSENGRELRVYDSELAKVDAQFQGTEKSVEALTKKNEVLDRTLTSQKERISLLRTELERANTEYGTGDKRTQRLAEQLNKAETAAYKTENAIKSNKNALGNMNDQTFKASDLLSTLSGKLGINLPAGIGKSIDQMINFTGVSSTMALGITAAVTAVVKLEQKLKELTEEQGEKADKLLTDSAKYGVSTETLQEWDYASKFIDTTTSDMQSSFSKLTRSMSSARDGNKESTDAFEKLGVSVVDASGNLRDSQTVFWETIDALKNVSNETERDALTLQIFGKGAMDLNPLIKAGSEGFKKYTDEAHKLGVVMSDETTAALGKVDDATERANARMEAGKNLIADKFAPVVTKFDDNISELGLTLTEVLVDSGFLDILSSMFEIVANSLPLIQSVWALLSPFAGSVIKPIAAGLAIVADVLGVIFNTLALIIEMIRWLVTFGQSGSYRMQEYADNITGIFSNGATARFIKGYAGGTDNHPGGLAKVGENGWEYVELPRGSKVFPHEQSVNMARGRVPSYAQGIGAGGVTNYYYVTIPADSVREFNDIVRIAEEKRVSTRKGYTRR
jgi:hypothetical protein